MRIASTALLGHYQANASSEFEDLRCSRQCRWLRSLRPAQIQRRCKAASGDDSYARKRVDLHPWGLVRVLHVGTNDTDMRTNGRNLYRAKITPHTPGCNLIGSSHHGRRYGTLNSLSSMLTFRSFKRILSSVSNLSHPRRLRKFWLVRRNCGLIPAQPACQ